MDDMFQNGTVITSSPRFLFSHHIMRNILLIIYKKWKSEDHFYFLMTPFETIPLWNSLASNLRLGPGINFVWSSNIIWRYSCKKTWGINHVLVANMTRWIRLASFSLRSGFIEEILWKWVGLLLEVQMQTSHSRTKLIHSVALRPLINCPTHYP